MKQQLKLKFQTNTFIMNEAIEEKRPFKLETPSGRSKLVEIEVYKYDDRDILEEYCEYEGYYHVSDGNLEPIAIADILTDIQTSNKNRTVIKVFYKSGLVADIDIHGYEFVATAYKHEQDKRLYTIVGNKWDIRELFED